MTVIKIPYLSDIFLPKNWKIKFSNHVASIHEIFVVKNIHVEEKVRSMETNLSDKLGKDEEAFLPE